MVLSQSGISLCIPKKRIYGMPDETQESVASRLEK
jgi:hypothetical protein